MTKKLTDLVGAPYVFTLKDGKTKIHLGEFTLYSEIWAKKEFGSTEDFYNKIVGNPELGLEPDLDAVLKTIMFLMWEDDKNKFSSEIDLAKEMTYKNLKDAACALYSAIRDSMPEELLKKNLTVIQKRKTKGK